MHTFDPPVGFQSGEDYQQDDPFPFEDMEQIRQSIIVLGYLGNTPSLGGSDDSGLQNGAWTRVRAGQVFEFTKEDLDGLTLEAVTYRRAHNAATSVQLRIRNETDSTTEVTGTAGTSTSIVEEVLTVPLTAGTKKYSLEIIGGNTTWPVFGWGYLRFRKVPA